MISRFAARVKPFFASARPAPDARAAMRYILKMTAKKCTTSFAFAQNVDFSPKAKFTVERFGFLL